MRILAVSDEEAKALYDYYTPGMLKEYDLILACGDLKRRYLEFLVTMANRPLLYVRGNHDDGLIDDPPEGCICIDGKLYVQNGIRILGLGGSYRYRRGENMYTERQMCRRIRRLRFSIWRHGGFDILLTHAPARGLGDLETYAHRGFQCFRWLLDQYHPSFFVHGHIHKSYDMNVSAVRHYGGTTVINACGYHVFNWPRETDSGEQVGGTPS